MLDFISENVAGLAGTFDHWSVIEVLRYVNMLTNPRRLWTKYWIQYCNQSEPTEQPKVSRSTLYMPQIITLVYFLTIVAAIAIYKWRHRSKLYEYFPNENSASLASDNSVEASFEDDFLNRLRHFRSLSSRLLDLSSSSSSFKPSDLLNVFTRGPIPETLEMLFGDGLKEQKNGVEELLGNERFLNDLETNLNSVLSILRTRLNGPFSNGHRIDEDDNAIQVGIEDELTVQQRDSQVEKPSPTKSLIEIGTGFLGSQNQPQMAQEAIATPEEVSDGYQNNGLSESPNTKPKVTECKSSANGSTLNIQIDFDRNIRLG